MRITDNMVVTLTNALRIAHDTQQEIYITFENDEGIRNFSLKPVAPEAVKEPILAHSDVF